jgi:1-acyl-sn-glycerol-3-phosphate acyltransferase
MTFLRSLLYAALFYPATALFALAGFTVSLASRRPMHSVVLGWSDFNHWLARHVLGIRTRVEGAIPPGAYLIAVKHQSMFETTELVRLSNSPVIVIKRELADIPVFGWLTRRYGVIAVDRSAGAKALRRLVTQGKAALATGRSVIIYPEGTRVPVGHRPPLKSGFAALYKVLGLPVVPVALDSGRLWGRSFIKRSGTVTIKVGEAIPPGLPRDEIEARVHAAINALDLAPEASA